MATEPPTADAQRTQRVLNRLAEGLVKLFGSKQSKVQLEPAQQANATVPQQAPHNSNGDFLEQTLARFDSMPQEMSELRKSLTDVLHNFEMAIDHMGIEAKRLSNESAALALMADKLQMRLGDLQRTLNGDVPLPRSEQVIHAQPVAATTELQFRPSDLGINVALAPITGFQELMDVQRTLTGLPETETASVVNFRNGEANLQLVLTAPVTASRIVHALAQETGEELLIEESRPDAQRLRLRFVEEESRR